MELYFPRAAPQVCAPIRHNHQFFSFVGKWPFLAKKVETAYVPDGCIYLPHIFGDGIKVPKVCSDDIFDQKKFSKIFEIFTPES